jgi:hypothetical protein
MKTGLEGSTGRGGGIANDWESWRWKHLRLISSPPVSAVACSFDRSRCLALSARAAWAFIPAGLLGPAGISTTHHKAPMRSIASGALGAALPGKGDAPGR